LLYLIMRPGRGRYRMPRPETLSVPAETERSAI